MIFLYIGLSNIDVGRFWDFVRQKNFETFTTRTGNIFEQINNGKYLMSYNPAALHNNVIFTLGRLLFWTLIHNGFWPYWLDPFHIQSIFEIACIDTKSIYLEINPIVGLGMLIGPDRSGSVPRQFTNCRSQKSVITYFQ